MHEPAVRAVLARWYPGREIAVERAGSGTSTPVFRVRIDGQTSYARLGEHPGDRRVGEVTAYRYLESVGLPVPRVLAWEGAPAELDRAIALTSAIPGVPLADIPSSRALGGTMVVAGMTLASINRTAVTGYGWITGVTDDDMLRAEHETRAAWAVEYLAAATTVSAAKALSPTVTERVRAAVEAWAALPGSVTSHLAHGDLDATHVYIDPASGAFTGIIDFGEIRGADRLYDLGHLLLHDGEADRPRIVPGVVAGYASVTPLPDDVMTAIRMQAIVIGTRALAIQLGRSPSPYRDWLVRRLGELTTEERGP